MLFSLSKKSKRNASNECSVQLYRDANFRKWLRCIIGASHLPPNLQNNLVNNMDELMKYAEHRAYHTTPEYDDEAVIQAVAAPLSTHPIHSQRPVINPNLLVNPFNEAQQQQIFLNQQMQMMHQQQQFQRHQFFQWQQMQHRFR